MNIAEENFDTVDNVNEDYYTKYVLCMKQAQDKTKMAMENLLPPYIRNDLKKYRDEMVDIDEIRQAVIEKTIKVIENDKKFETDEEIFDAKANLEEMDQALRKVLMMKMKELQILFDFHYSSTFIPKQDVDTASADTASLLSKSDQHVSDHERLIGKYSEQKVHKQFKDQMKILEKTVEEGKSSEEIEDSFWEPPKIVIGPETKYKKTPCLIQFGEPNESRYDNLFDKISKVKQVPLPQITSNTELFFKQQVKSKSYFKSLFLLTEHYKQGDLLLRCLGEAINKFPNVDKNPNKVNGEIEQRKSKLNEQVKEIEKEFKNLYTIVGIKDICKVTLPLSENYYERKYGFIEETELNNLISKYVTENKRLKKHMERSEQIDLERTINA